MRGLTIIAPLLAALTSFACAGELEVQAPRPIADAGFDQRRQLPADIDALDIAIDGRASCDPTNPAAALTATWTIEPFANSSAPGSDGSPQRLPIVDVGDPLRMHFVAGPGSYWVQLSVAVAARRSDPDALVVTVVPDDGTARDDVVVEPPDTNACGADTAL